MIAGSLAIGIFGRVDLCFSATGHRNYQAAWLCDLGNCNRRTEICTANVVVAGGYYDVGFCRRPWQ